jgi:hypothetical protein
MRPIILKSNDRSLLFQCFEAGTNRQLINSILHGNTPKKNKKQCDYQNVEMFQKYFIVVINGRIFSNSAPYEKRGHSADYPAITYYTQFALR